MGRKPAWAIERERERRDDGGVWLFGLHAVRDALANPARVRRRLVVTRNAAERLAEAIAVSGLPRARRPAPVRRAARPAVGAPGRGARGRAARLGLGLRICAPRGGTPVVLLLDRVTDPHNVGAILRSAEVFGARAVIAPRRHAAPETGALAKAASGALERQPYLRVPNLAGAMGSLREMGYAIVGLDGGAEAPLDAALGPSPDGRWRWRSAPRGLACAS